MFEELFTESAHQVMIMVMLPFSGFIFIGLNFQM